MTGLEEKAIPGRGTFVPYLETFGNGKERPVIRMQSAISAGKQATRGATRPVFGCLRDHNIESDGTDDNGYRYVVEMAANVLRTEAQWGAGLVDGGIGGVQVQQIMSGGAGENRTHA